MAISRRRILGTGAPLLLAVFAAERGQAQPLGGTALISALRRGGLVLVMRHANSPPNPPENGTAEPANIRQERQLDDAGRKSAAAMGDALKILHIPVGQVWSSPAYRACETIQLASLGVPRIVPELAEGAKDMQSSSDLSRVAWLRTKTTQAPKAGTNIIIVTHLPNIVGAFGQSAAGMTSGESLVFHPDGNGGGHLVARIKIDEWANLSKQP